MRARFERDLEKQMPDKYTGGWESCLHSPFLLTVEAAKVLIQKSRCES